MQEKKSSKEFLPEPTLRRLPWYLAYVSQLNSHGIETVSSTRMAEELHVDSSQIAKDLSYLNIRGKTRIGYDVPLLENRLVTFLGFREVHTAVVVGAGSLGAALMRDSGLWQYGLNIVAGFDTDPTKIGCFIGGTEIFHPDHLAEVVVKANVAVAIITVPFSQARQAAAKCTDAGIRALWNFTPARLSVPDGFVVQNTSIYSDLSVMYNRMKNTDDDQ